MVTAYDSQYCQNLGAISDQKGCHCFAVNEKNHSLVIANKKKLYQYAWQSPGFSLVREFTLTDTAKSLIYVRNSVVIGLRKHYECLDLVTGSFSRILDVEREHRMVTLEVKDILLNYFISL